MHHLCAQSDTSWTEAQKNTSLQRREHKSEFWSNEYWLSAKAQMRIPTHEMCIQELKREAHMRSASKSWNARLTWDPRLSFRLENLEIILSVEIQTWVSKTRVQNSQNGELTRLAFIHRCEGRVDKAKKRKDHQTRVLLFNARTASTNQMRTCEIRVHCSKLQEVKRTKPLYVHNNGESHS